MAGLPRHYNCPGSKCQHDYGKLGKGTTSVQNTPPLPPQLGTSVGVVWVWVGGFQKFWPFVPLRQNGMIINIFIFMFGSPYLNK